MVTHQYHVTNHVACTGKDQQAQLRNIRARARDRAKKRAAEFMAELMVVFVKWAQEVVREFGVSPSAVEKYTIDLESDTSSEMHRAVDECL